MSTVVQLFAVHDAPESNFDEFRTTVVAAADAFRPLLRSAAAGLSNDITSDQLEVRL